MQYNTVARTTKRCSRRPHNLLLYICLLYNAPIAIADVCYLIQCKLLQLVGHELELLLPHQQLQPDIFRAGAKPRGSPV